MVGTRKRTVYSIWACLVACTVLILIVSWTVQSFSDRIYENIRESTTVSVQALTSDRVKMLDKTLELLQAQVQTLSLYLSSTEHPVTPANLQSLPLPDPNFIRLVVIYADGTAVSSDGAVTSVPKESTEYQQVLSGQCGTTDTFLGSMGYEEVNVYAPLYHGTNIIGGVYLNLNAEVLRSAGKDPLYDASGYSYLLKRDGTILLAPSSYSFAQIYHNIQDVFLISKNNQATVDAFMSALQNGDSGSAILDFSGEMQIICFQPSTQRPDWCYVSVLPISLAENNGQEVMRLSSRMISLFCAVIFLFAIFLTTIILLFLREKWKKDVNEGHVYKAISENIHTAIFIMDKPTRYIRHAFENTSNILGIPAAEVQGSTLSSAWLKQLGLPAEVLTLTEQVDATHQPITIEIQHKNPYLKQEVWLSISVSPMQLKGRQEYMVAFTDITENKRLMEELRSSMLEAQSANAAKSSFLANMSHDIRTPMNAITGMTDIALAHRADPSRVLDCLHKIRLSSRHLKGLINDILDMSKIESGKLFLNPDVASLTELLEGLTSIAQVQAAERHQKLLVLVKEVEHETVYCDAVRLNQVLLNILANAVKFTPDGGNIRFYIQESASAKGVTHRQYQFRIKDSGIGMSPEFQNSIFESFSRERNQHIDKIEGTGLGMAISKWIVDQMGGSIQVFSAPGKGSEFVVTVDFPLAGEAIDLSCLSGQCLLLVEEDTELRESTAAMLRRGNAQTDTAADVQGVRACLTSDKVYDAVIVNCAIFHSPPAEAVSAIRGYGKQHMILLLCDTLSYTEQNLPDGADDYLCPPLFPSTLCHSLTQARSVPVGTLPPDTPLQGCRILLAEDNALNREIAVELLTSYGATMEVVHDGKQCLERILVSPPGYFRLILMDIQMPVMNGYEATRQIRASNHADAKNIPILAVTADAFSEDIEAAKQAGMNGHISKPLDIKQVISEIQKHLPAKK